MPHNTHFILAATLVSSGQKRSRCNECVITCAFDLEACEFVG